MNQTESPTAAPEKTSWIVNLGTRKGNYIAIFDSETEAKTFATGTMRDEEYEYCEIKEVRKGWLVSVD